MSDHLCSSLPPRVPFCPGGLFWFCFASLAQGSIVHSIAKAGVEVDFQILVSIYNPNMLDAKIESGTAILSHKHTPVCTYAN